MLILDKQKALEHLADLSARPAMTVTPRRPGRSYQRVARFERRMMPAPAPAPAEPPAFAADPGPRGRRVLHPALDTTSV